MIAQDTERRAWSVHDDSGRTAFPDDRSVTQFCQVQYDRLCDAIRALAQMECSVAGVEGMLQSFAIVGTSISDGSKFSRVAHAWMSLK